MALMDEFKEERKAVLENGTTKQKILYIWDYYKLWILGGIFAIYLLISGIYQYVTAKDVLLQMIMVNGYIPLEETIFAEDYLTDSGYSTEDYEIVSSRVELKMTTESYAQDYYTMQSLIAQLTSGTIDIFSASPDIMKPYMTEGYFMDLREILSADEISQYENLLVYTTDEKTNETYPCAFDFTNNEWIKTHKYYTESCYFGIMYNSPNLEQAKDFLLYLLNY